MNAALGSSTYRPVIRLAQPDEGQLVHDLFTRFHGPSVDWFDWNDVYPYWLIGEIDFIPQGIVMVVPAKPFGFVENLHVNPALPTRAKAILARDLGYAAHDILRKSGAQGAFSTVGAAQTSWETIMKHRGAIETGFGTFLLMRLSCPL